MANPVGLQKRKNGTEGKAFSHEVGEKVKKKPCTHTNSLAQSKGSPKDRDSTLGWFLSQYLTATSHCSCLGHCKSELKGFLDVWKSLEVDKKITAEME